MIYNISIGLLSQNREIHCQEDDLALCDRHTLIPYIYECFQTNMLMIFICQAGQLRMEVGYESVTLNSGDIYVCKPVTTIHRVTQSQDCHTSVLFYSTFAADHLLPTHLTLVHVLEGGYKPKIHVIQSQMASTILPLLNMLQRNFEDTEIAFCSNTIFHNFALLLFEILNRTCDKSMTSSDAMMIPSRSDSLFNQFVKLLKEDAGRHRTVGYYADKLCVTSEHLSKTIKRNTNTGALRYINRHAIHQIKLDLKLTDSPINQLADKYQFNSLSFFCHFVKTHLGVTPQEYRFMSK